jgi:hypothetical protein
MKGNQMANTKQVAKATSITSTTQDNLVVLTPAIQRQVKVLRESRNIIKQAKPMEKTSREAILDFVGNITKSITGTDARGTRLIKVSVIESSASFDWDRLQKDDPELYTLLKKKYTIPKGSEPATLRVDII